MRGISTMPLAFFRAPRRSVRMAGSNGWGRSFTLALHEFHHIADGRLTHTWHLEDWFGWLNQIGAWLPAKTAS